MTSNDASDSVGVHVIEVTTRIGCSLLCTYCPQSLLTSNFRKLEHPRHTLLEPESFTRYLATVPETVDVHFSGFAEPWHNPHCSDLVEYAVRKGHRVAVFSTADRMSVRDIERLSKLELKRIVVHLPDAFSEMKLVVDEAYCRKIELLASLFHPQIEFMTLGVAHPAFAKRFVGRHMISRRVQDRAGNLVIDGRTVGSAYSSEEIAKRLEGKTLRCRKARMTSNVLLPNGDLAVCAMDYGLNHLIGNLGAASYRDILSGKKFTHFLKSMERDSHDLICSRCEYAYPGRYTDDEIARFISDA